LFSHVVAGAVARGNHLHFLATAMRSCSKFPKHSICLALRMHWLLPVTNPPSRVKLLLRRDRRRRIHGAQVGVRPWHCSSLGRRSP
jgi:hypothetical protein